jgi:hypothetical protein
MLVGFWPRRDEMGAILSRRSLLRGAAALVPGLALLGSGRGAQAFSMETMSPGSALGLAYSNRCGGDSMHPVITARLEADLANQTGPVGTTLSETAVCPICGCPITVTRVVR